VSMLSSRKVLSTCLLVVCLLVVIDQSINIAGYSFLKPPFISYHVANAVPIDVFWKVKDREPIILIGSSTMWVAGSPRDFDIQIQALTGKSVFAINLGQNGADLELVSDLIRNFLVPNGTKVVMYGIESRALHQYGLDALFLATPLGYALHYSSGPEQTIWLW